MAATNITTNTNKLSRRSFLGKKELTGPNFLNWRPGRKIMIRHERKRIDLERTMLNSHTKDAKNKPGQAFYACKAFTSCKMAKGTSVSAHVMKMKVHIDHLARLGHHVPLQLAIDMILNSLSDDYKSFVANYNECNMDKSISELHSMLEAVELNIGTDSKSDLTVTDSGDRERLNGKRKGKTNHNQRMPSGKMIKQIGKKVKPNIAKAENRCFKCGEVGHWKLDCPKIASSGGLASSSGGNAK